MRCNCVVEVFIKDNVASSVAPASHVHGNTDDGRMARSVFDIDTEHGILSAHALRSKADRICNSWPCAEPQQKSACT